MTDLKKGRCRISRRTSAGTPTAATWPNQHEPENAAVPDGVLLVQWTVLMPSGHRLGPIIF